MASTSIAPPVYRYFTVDLVSNQVLAEIPFKGVSYERALKGAGPFSGNISISPDTEHLNIYDNTLPGKTAIYVMRDDQCVWGGIIWSRSYDVVSKKLSVNASEFTSYFHHRRIWKTWTNNYTADLTVANGIISGRVDDGMTYSLSNGSTVNIVMSDVQYFAYNGYYELTEESTVDSQNVVYFKASTTSVATPSRASVVMPDGVYNNVSLAIRTNTYDYVRSLIEAVSKDFYGTKFANAEITPAKETVLKIVEKEISNGVAKITTESTHSVVPGQEFRTENIGSTFDGYHLATAVTANTITYTHGGYYAPEAVSPLNFMINSRSVSNGVATLTVSSPTTLEKLYPGAQITVAGVDSPTGGMAVYDGKVTVTNVPSTTSFSYLVSGSKEELPVTLYPPTVTKGSSTAFISAKGSVANTVLITTPSPHGFGSNGSSITINVAGITSTYSIIGKQLVDNVITFTTSTAHDFSVGNPVTVSGVGEVTNIKGASMTLGSVDASFTVTTEIAHNLKAGDTLSVANVTDTYTVTAYEYQAANNLAVFTTSGSHNIKAGDAVEVTEVSSQQIAATKIKAINNQVTITTGAAHGLSTNANVIVSGYPDNQWTVASIARAGTKSTTKTPTLVTVHFNSAIAILKEGDYITTAWNGTYSNFPQGTYKITYISPDRKALYYDDGKKIAINTQSVPSPGKLTKPAGVNGTFTIGLAGATTITYYAGDAADIAEKNVTGVNVSAENPINQKYSSVTAVTSSTFTVSSEAFPGDTSLSGVAGKATVVNGVFCGTNLEVTEVVSGTSVTYKKDLSTNVHIRVAKAPTANTGTAIVTSSLFNAVNAPITAVTRGTFSFALSPGQVKRIDSSSVQPNGTAISAGIVTGNNISATIVDEYNIRYAKPGTGDSNYKRVFGYATGEFIPATRYGTFGGYTKNSNIDFEFSTSGYSTTQTLPADLRGYAAANVGEELDKYSDVINGFEYRVDCSLDPNTGKFKRTFVMLPIFPDSLVEYLSSLPGGKLYLGDAAPASAFGADKLVFEFPGNIGEIGIEESAENSATRFFMTGNLGFIGGDSSQPYAAAVATDLLNPTGGRMSVWPLLDDAHSDGDIYDETVLYNYAQRYLSEAKPPDAKINVKINGSITPPIGSYSPGDWCTLIINDDFVKQRLTNDLEPRSNVIIRKIDSLSVSVPDGVTYPESISLTLVPEWQADQIGQ